jgi:hypothetical protein
MSGLFSVIYYSTTTRLLTEAELEALLIDARDFNKEHGITGVLLYVNGSFMQYFEGLEDDVNQTLKRINDSSKHKDIFKVVESIDERNFPNWLMGFSRPDKSEILKLHAASWLASVKNGEGCKAMNLLKQFWSTKNR